MWRLLGLGRNLSLCSGLFCCAIAVAQVAPVPTANGLPGRPYSIKKTWVIGGLGNWDYLTMDPAAHLLYITHGPSVQVVDVETGLVTATIGGFREAHQVALDDQGQFGYVTDGPADLVRVFDRSTFKVVAVVPTGPRPRSLTYDAQSGLVLVFCAGPVATTATNQASGSGQQPRGGNNGRPAVRPDKPLSTITVIDGQTHVALAHIIVAGRLGFGQTGGDGHVYVTDEERNQIARFDVQALGTAARDLPPPADDSGNHASKVPSVDWSGAGSQQTGPVRAHYLPLSANCHNPRNLAIDGKHQRLFVACDNMKMAVINSDSADPVTSLTTGPGADAIAYDADRGLIYTANGGGYGSVTVIQQDLMDNYTVVQNLPTMQQARTMAIDPTTGDVYLVTTLYGAKLNNPPAHGIGTLKVNAVDGSFQVLVIGN